MGDPFVPKVSQRWCRNRAEHIAGVDLRETSADASSQQRFMVYRARFAGGPCDFFSLRPLDFDRGQAEK